MRREATTTRRRRCGCSTWRSGAAHGRSPRWTRAGGSSPGRPPCASSSRRATRPTRSAHPDRLAEDGPVETERPQHEINGVGYTDTVTSSLSAVDVSPVIRDVGTLDTPLLVMAGGEDWRCPPSQSEQLSVSAKAQGVPAKPMFYPNEHHAIRKPGRAVHRLEEMRA